MKTQGRDGVGGPEFLPLLTYKTSRESRKAAREHLIGFQGVKLFLLKDVTITTVTTASVTTTVSI